MATTIESLQSEVERLTRELDLATSEINQSAKYGLGLLEEKQSLQSKCEELENLYENTRHELEITQEVSFSYFFLSIFLLFNCSFWSLIVQFPFSNSFHGFSLSFPQNCSIFNLFSY